MNTDCGVLQQESIALLKIIAMGEDDIKAGRVVSVDEAFAAARKRIGRQSA